MAYNDLVLDFQHPKTGGVISLEAHPKNADDIERHYVAKGFRLLGRRAYGDPVPEYPQLRRDPQKGS